MLRRAGRLGGKQICTGAGVLQKIELLQKAEISKDERFFRYQEMVECFSHIYGEVMHRIHSKFSF
jgi:hypothetical protein